MVVNFVKSTVVIFQCDTKGTLGLGDSILLSFNFYSAMEEVKYTELGDGKSYERAMPIRHATHANSSSNIRM
jgi:hypothetical protein